jgi:hypothetical protein
VADAVAGRQLDGVADGVAEVERLAAPVLARVLGDHGGLDGDAVGDDARQAVEHGRVARGRARRERRQQRGRVAEVARVGDHAVLERLGGAGGQVGRRQRA